MRGIDVQPVNLFNFMQLAQLRSSLAQTMAIHRGHGLHRDNELWCPRGRHRGLQRHQTGAAIHCSQLIAECRVVATSTTSSAPMMHQLIY